MSCVAALLLTPALPLYAQTQAARAATPNVIVRVVDAQQLPIPGAVCTLQPPTGPSAATMVSDAQGVCAADGVERGTYTLRIQLDGFEPYSRSALVVAGDPIRVDAVLLISHLAQNVTVSAPRAGEGTMADGATAAAGTIERRALQRLPLAAATVQDALPLIPGVLRTTTGELSFKGAGEAQNGLLVNGLNGIDPGTGGFRLSLPVDSVEAVQVFLYPYAAEYGLFTGGLTRVETRPGGDHWHFEFNDFLPDPRLVNGRIIGIAEDEPHLNMNGPIFGARAVLSQSIAYAYSRVPVRGLDYPVNETETQSLSSFTQLDFSVHRGHKETVTAGFYPERLDYVGLDVFSPQPTTPNLSRKDVAVTARDNSELFGGLLTSSLSMHRFDVGVGPQGTADMTLTPTGARGNYFATQDRLSSRTELLEVYSVPTRHVLGTHDFKTGLDVNWNHSDVTVSARPVDILRADGTLAQQIVFDGSRDIMSGNQEYVGFVQDRWTLRPRLSLDLGLRYENEQIADATLFAPRAGFAWSPQESGQTIVRGGVGEFYDEVPLNIRSFARYPTRTVTFFDPLGDVTGQVRYRNVLVDAVEIKTFDPRKSLEQTEFVPENLTWNLQMDRTETPWFAWRANVMASRTSSLYIVDPDVTFSGHDVIVLKSTGRADYTALELTGRFGHGDRLLNVSYTRSHATGDLNAFSSFYGDLATPVVRDNQYSLQPTDAPNRLLAWGTIALPRQFSIAPLLEVRSGFPYSVLDEEQNFVGVRNSGATRFPRFVALDLEVAKEVKLTGKYAVRLSMRAFNVTNHFNPRDVHANTGDPLFGQFLASYRRYFTGGFDILF